MAFKIKDRRYSVLHNVERLGCAAYTRRAESFFLSKNKRRPGAAYIKLSVRH